MENHFLYLGLSEALSLKLVAAAYPAHRHTSSLPCVCIIAKGPLYALERVDAQNWALYFSKQQFISTQLLSH